MPESRSTDGDVQHSVEAQIKAPSVCPPAVVGQFYARARPHRFSARLVGRQVYIRAHWAQTQFAQRVERKAEEFGKAACPQLSGTLVKSAYPCKARCMARLLLRSTQSVGTPGR